MKNFLRSIAAPIAGYITIVIGALIFQDLIFGLVTHDSSLLAIVIGGGMTSVMCVVAGYLLSLIAPFRPFLHALPLVIWLAIETTIVHFEFGGPLWFDAMAGGSNMVGVLLGVYVWKRIHSDPGTHAAGVA